MNAKAVCSILLPLLLFSCHDFGELPVDYHNRILFTSERAGFSQIFMMNPDCADIGQITSGPYRHFSARWSPDATRIVCNTSQGLMADAPSPIIVINADGTNPHFIGGGENMAWSRDGKRIAYACALCGIAGSQIFVVNADGTGSLQLTRDPGVWDDNPDWSIDDTRIFFSSNRANPNSVGSSGIYVMNADGSNIQPVDSVSGDSSGAPALSPQGNLLAFDSWYAGDAGSGVFVSNTINHAMHRVVARTSAEIFGHPRWGPNGTQLVIQSYSTNGSANSHIYTVNVDGTGLTCILNDTTASYPDWSQ